MSQPVYISGMGIISALGDDWSLTHQALVHEKSGIKVLNHLPTNHQFLAGEVHKSNAELAQLCGQKDHYSRTILLGAVALKQALVDAGLENTKDVMFVNGTTVAGMDISETLLRKRQDDQPLDFSKFYQHDCGFCTDQLARSIGVKRAMTISTACSSSANAIMTGMRLIESKKAECVIVGGTDALSIFTLNGFNALKILDPEWCKPFDTNRKGLNLGEGAAYLVLESKSHLESRGAKAKATVLGYGHANDAYHQTASSPEATGATLAMNRALNKAGVSADDIDYVNAHGTGTNNNDSSELTAFLNVFGTKNKAYSSTKAYTGHTLGAAGAIEAVISIMGMINGEVYPSLNISEPMDERQPIQSVTSLKQSTIMSNSFGFGGNCTTLIFGHP